MKIINSFILTVAVILLMSFSIQGQVIFFEDFESGIGNWYADNGAWQVGVPTVGPTPYGGESLAATNLHGNYPPDANTRLVSPPISLPQIQSGERIQLRFWHWYYIRNGKGRIQISVNGGEWQTVPNPTPFGGYNIAWTQYIADISCHAGSMIQIGFWFTSGHGGAGERAGWYVDNVSIDITSSVMPNPEDFESGIGDWYADNGAWQVGPHPDFGPGRAHSGENVAATVLEGKYFPDANTRLVSPPISLPQIQSGEWIQLKFWHWYYILNGKGRIQISVNGGEWQIVQNSRSFQGYNISDYTQYIAYLTPYAGSTARIGFWFTSGHGGKGERAGWYIDDISIDVLGTDAVTNYSVDILTFRLYDAFPNPFNSSTVIQYNLSKLSHVALKIYNTLGQQVAVLINECQIAGSHSVVWNGRDNTGNPIVSGVYLYCLTTADLTETKKMVLIK